MINKEELSEIEVTTADFTGDQLQEADQPTPAPKKRGRKPISDEEKKRRRKLRDKRKKETEADEPQAAPRAKKEAVNIDDIISQHNATTAEIEEEKQDDESDEQQIERNNKKISGIILLTVIDAIFPLALIKIGGMFFKKLKKVDYQKIKLTDEEKNDLSEIADEVAQMIDANPLVLLSISLGGIYLSKLTSEI